MGTPLTVAVVDDDSIVRKTLTHMLQQEGCDVVGYEQAQDFLESLKVSTPQAAFIDITLPGMSGLELLELLTQRVPELTSIVISGDSTVETVVEAMSKGAQDFVDKPIERRRLITILNQLRRRTDAPAKPDISGIIGESEPMRKLYDQIRRLAVRDTTVLIQGESGSGKELVANAIHNLSGRASEPFIAVNCAAIPASLQESVLFGHEKRCLYRRRRNERGRV